MRIPKIFEFFFLFFLLFTSNYIQIISKEVSEYDEIQKENQKIPSVFFIDITKSKVTITKDFENDLMSSTNPHLFMIIGPSRQGKSSLFNTIYNREYKAKIPFKVASGDIPVTQDFEYVKINSKKLAELHGINKDSVIDSDIFLIDSEGLKNIKNMFLHSRLYLGGTVLQTIISGLVYLCKGYPGTTEYEDIKSYLLMGKLLGGNNSFIHTLIIMSGVSFEGEEEAQNLSMQSKNSIIHRLYMEHLSFEDKNKIDVFCLKHIDVKDEYMLGIKNIAEKILGQLQKNNPKGNPSQLFERLQITADLINSSEVELKSDNIETIFKEFSKKIIEKTGSDILEKHLNNMREYIMNLSPEKLRELDRKNNRTEELELKDKRFKDELETNVFRKYNVYSYMLEEVIKNAEETINKKYETEVKNYIDEKFQQTIVYPKNINELCDELKITQLSSGVIYTLFHNKKPYKVKAIDKDKITLEGFKVTKYHIEYDSTDGKKKKEIENNDIVLHFNPDLMIIEFENLSFRNGNYLEEIGFFKSWFFNPHEIKENERIEITVGNDLKINKVDGENIVPKYNNKSHTSLICRVENNDLESTITKVKITPN